MDEEMKTTHKFFQKANLIEMGLRSTTSTATNAGLAIASVDQAPDNRQQHRIHPRFDLTTKIDMCYNILAGLGLFLWREL
jgi:hypothetical protein